MFIRQSLRRLGQRGDTLVEVLIAIAVVSVIIGGAYVTTNNSLQATRTAQERGDALKLLQSQLEDLKQLSSSNPTAIFSAGIPNKFCISGNTNVIDATGAAGAQCVLSAANVPATVEPEYHMSITRQTDGHTFIITNTWAALGSNVNPTNTLQMAYRVYQQ